MTPFLNIFDDLIIRLMLRLTELKKAYNFLFVNLITILIIDRATLEIRTPSAIFTVLHANQLHQTGHIKYFVGIARLERATTASQMQHSNQLNYIPNSRIKLK